MEILFKGSMAFMLYRLWLCRGTSLKIFSILSASSVWPSFSSLLATPSGEIVSIDIASRAEKGEFIDVDLPGKLVYRKSEFSLV